MGLTPAGAARELEESEVKKSERAENGSVYKGSDPGGHNGNLDLN